MSFLEWLTKLISNLTSMFARKESNGINIHGNGNFVFAPTFIVSDVKAANAIKEYLMPPETKQVDSQPEKENGTNNPAT